MYLCFVAKPREKTLFKKKLFVHQCICNDYAIGVKEKKSSHNTCILDITISQENNRSMLTQFCTACTEFVIFGKGRSSMIHLIIPLRKPPDFTASI